MALDHGDHNLYVTDVFAHTIRKVSLDTPTPVVSTVAGAADGVGYSARFDSPVGLALDSSGRLFVGDTNNDDIRMVA